MAIAISRRKLAQYAAAEIMQGNAQAAIARLAAYLLHTRRTREADLLARDIELQLLHSGVAIAKVTTAHSLTDQLRSAVEALINADTTYLNEVIDPSVLGGIRVELPGKQYDATVQRRLTTLRELTLT